LELKDLSGMVHPGQALLLMSNAYRTSQLVYVAAKLGVADVLTDGPRTADEIASAVGASPDALGRVLRGLVMLGVFDELEDGRFALTEMSRLLTSGQETSVREAVIFRGQEQYRAWADLLQTVLTGEPAFRRIFGDPFEYYEAHPETAEVFDAFMTSGAQQMADGILSNCEFPPTGTVVDVAGGEGRLLAGILKSLPEARGVLLERRPVVAKARRLLAAEGVLGRCRLVAGDCRRSVPRGGDTYILMRVLHDWDDPSAIAILTACRRAMKPAARLLVIQRVLPPKLRRARHHQSLVESDLMQLVYNGGRERTMEQYGALMRAAGLRVHQSMTFLNETSIIEVHPAT
jgi:hypothetical protein